MNIYTQLSQFNHPALIYLITIFLFAIILIMIVLAKLNSLNILRLERLKRRKNFDAVKTQAPVDDSAKEARKIGIKSIQSQFTVGKRIIIPFIIVTAILVAMLPFIDRIPGAVLSLFVGIFTLILGIAARPYIENFIAGLIISYSRTINIGDTILLHGTYGTVEDITPSHTIVKIWDWRRYVVPNSKMLQSELINYSTNDMYQWAHVEFYVSYDSDIAEVEKLAKEAPCASRYYSDYEEPKFWIMDMTKEGILCWLAAWASSPSNAWQLKHDMRTELIKKMKAQGIKTHHYSIQQDRE